MRSQEIQTWSELRIENNQCYQKMNSAVVGIHYYTFTENHLLIFVSNK